MTCCCGLCVPNMIVAKANAKENPGEFIIYLPFHYDSESEKQVPRFNFVIVFVRMVIGGQEVSQIRERESDKRATTKGANLFQVFVRNVQPLSFGRMAPKRAWCSSSKIENAPTCYRAPKWPDPEFPRKMPKKYPPARNSGLPEFTPKIPRKYRKNTPKMPKNTHFWYFFDIFGVFSWGSPEGYFFGIFRGNSGSGHLGAL